MIYNCPFDNTNFYTVEELCSHIKKFKIKQSDFFQEFYPRKDKLTGELINFKNPDQYLSSDFSNKNNLKKWLKINPEDGKKWAIDWLINRKNKKNLIYAPTQVELKSLICPTIHYYNSIGNYEEICKSIGYKIKFTENSIKIRDIKDPVLIQDTREQLPLKTNFKKIIIKKIDSGDYALDEPNDNKIYIERKSIQDMVGTLGRNLERFCKELDRAKKNDSYIVVLVESNINEALGFNYLFEMRYTRMNPSHIFKNLRDLYFKYDNFQCLFVNGRKEAAIVLEKILLADNIKNIDLQFLYESGGLI